MKDVSKVLKNAYKTTLNNLSVNGQQIPFYKLVPQTTNEHYMHVSDFSQVDDSDKDSFCSECTITVDIVSKYHNSYGNEDSADDIADQVMQTILTKPSGYLSLSGFTILTTSLDGSDQFLTEKLKKDKRSETQMVRSLRFRHKIQED